MSQGTRLITHWRVYTKSRCSTRASNRLEGPSDLKDLGGLAELDVLKQTLKGVKNGDLAARQRYVWPKL